MTRISRGRFRPVSVGCRKTDGRVFLLFVSVVGHPSSTSPASSCEVGEGLTESRQVWRYEE